MTLTRFYFLLMILLSVPLITLADSTPVTLLTSLQNQIVHRSVSQNAIKTQASEWGLSMKDFRHYVWLMHNTPSGHWYKTLDPAEVLALNAKNPDEMMKYAKIQARNMHARVTRELAFDKRYTQAYRTLYPNEKPVKTPGIHRLNDKTLQSGDRVWLFVGLNTPLGRFAYQHLIKAIQAVPGTALDIYFVGQGLSPQQIRDWAAAVGISRKILNQQVTLNIGNDRFKTVAQGKKVALPFVGVVHRRRFQPITLSSVL